ncbi:hypothetical protein [Muricoccus nepalensis]|uniref:hypothetical protein n=1 Tax=Muricoccus nepalensis TaxID=1854500 RepID=UPI0011283CDC|nr:hypothetical protein [Roseomonas nepalensis]
MSDMMCTAHAGLRDRYKRRALGLDLAILLPSAWLAALAFVEPRINLTLTPFGFEPQVWVGLLGVAVFGLSIVQLRVDWKGRADAHARAFEGYTEVKRDAGVLLAASAEITEQACRPIFARYGAAGATSIPEGDFLRQKQRHLLKIAISKHLDSSPAASLTLTRLRFWLKDNFSYGKRDAT